MPETLDILVHSPNPLSIQNELVLPIEHYLLVQPGTRAEAVKVIFAHPQSLAQCRGFVERRFPEATVEAALSNSAAVEEMMGQEGAAAIGTRRAAEIYGAETLAKGIQDRSPNLTRFVVLGTGGPRADGRRPDFDRAARSSSRTGPGCWSVRSRSSRERGINLSKIESRPSREKLGRTSS